MQGYRGAEVQGCRGSGVQDAGMQEYRCVEMQVCRGLGMQECRMQACRGSGMQECSDSGMQVYRGSGVQDAGMQGAGMKVCRDSEVQGHMEGSHGWLCIFFLDMYCTSTEIWATLLSKFEICPLPFVHFSHLFSAVLRKMNMVELIVL